MAAPREWRPSLIRVDISVDDLARTTLLRNGHPLPLLAKQTAAGLCAFAEWPLSGTGRYRLHLDVHEYQETREVTVIPEKISQDAYAKLIDELQTRLPASIAINLQRLGAFAGLQLRPPGETTLEQEFFRLRKAVLGGETRPGLAVLLPAIGRDPHRILKKSEHWVERHRARRIEPVGLIAAYRQLSNIDPDTQLPRQVPNVRVEQTADVFENRLVKSYHDSEADAEAEDGKPKKVDINKMHAYRDAIRARAMNGLFGTPQFFIRGLPFSTETGLRHCRHAHWPWSTSIESSSGS